MIICSNVVYLILMCCYPICLAQLMLCIYIDESRPLFCKKARLIGARFRLVRIQHVALLTFCHSPFVLVRHARFDCSCIWFIDSPGWYTCTRHSWHIERLVRPVRRSCIAHTRSGVKYTRVENSKAYILMSHCTVDGRLFQQMPTGKLLY